MGLIVELTLHGDALLFDETFEGVPNAECAFEDVHYVTDDEGNARYVFFWWVTDCEFDEFDRALESDATVSAFRTVAKARERRLYRVATRMVPPGAAARLPPVS